MDYNYQPRGVTFQTTGISGVPLRQSPRGEVPGFLGNLDESDLPLAMEKMGKVNMDKLLELRK